MAEGPVKVTPAELGLGPSEEVDARLEFDLGNLCAYDPSPVDAEAYARDASGACASTASRIMQALVGRLFALPSEPADVGRIAELPAPTTALPREKPIPRPRPPTKWELFAKKKGITKHKRSKLVLDETSDTFKRRHGYSKANDPAAVPIIDAKDGEDVGDDPFSKQKRDKKARVAKQEKAQLANLKAAAKSGGKGALPPTLRLAAALPEHGRGRPVRHKDYKQELKAATRQAAISTASLGRHDRVVAGENVADRKLPGKRKKLPPVANKDGGERTSQSKLVDHILRKNADDIVDVGRAIGKFESAAREDRHRMKMKGANKKGRISKGAGAPTGKTKAGGVAKKGGREGSAKGRGKKA
ncbi:hypothetical protein ACKKBG_A30970 [Auxenochlorella protothecoides x Auxenochlorella symbiontica]